MGSSGTIAGVSRFCIPLSFRVSESQPAVLAVLSLPDDLEDPHMRHTRGRGDLAKACALGPSLADRGTPERLGLGATRCRPLHGCQGIGRIVLFISSWCLNLQR